MSARIFTGYVIHGKGGIVQGILSVLKEEAWRQAELKFGLKQDTLERDHGYAIVQVEIWSLP